MRLSRAEDSKFAKTSLPHSLHHTPLTPPYRRSISIEKGSGLYYHLKCIALIAVFTAFLAIELQLVYEYWMHIDLRPHRTILMMIVLIIAGALWYAILEPKYVII